MALAKRWGHFILTQPTPKKESVMAKRRHSAVAHLKKAHKRRRKGHGGKRSAIKA
jgi:hypothetical protein